MKILYLHGFGSEYNADSEKVKDLERVLGAHSGDLSTVLGYDIDYSRGSEYVIKQAVDFIENSRHAQEDRIGLIVGCSMGGWLASVVGEMLNIPVVALNPCLDPSVSLLKYVGEPQFDYTGKIFQVTEWDCRSYFHLFPQGSSELLVLLQSGDDVIDAHETMQWCERLAVKYCLTSGGSHRFEELYKYNDLIKSIL